ncbi:MAG: HAD hydrolase family protein [Candidatus Methanoperedens sp.]|nr:HAD hydrolase family protein [Candidatus Methanoperedens sp.]
MDNKYVALIPARGGSKSIPLKNIKHIAGKPLIFWTIEAALNCSKIDRVYLSTDSDEIKNVAKKIENVRFEVIGRSPGTAIDTASTESVVLEFSRKYDFENIILIQATSPLLKSDDLTQGIEIYEQKKADSLLSVVEQKRFIWRELTNGFVTALNYNPTQRPRRQDFKGYFVENGAFYITSKHNLEMTKCRISGNIAYYKMPEETYYELDEPSDWTIIEKLLTERQKPGHSLKEQLEKIKLLMLDVDGVMTDGGMYYSESGEELKKFNTRDGMGIQLLRERGIKVAFVTKENTKIVERRAKKLNVDELFQGVENKLTVLEELKDKYGLVYSEIAYIGDDVNDIPVLKMVGVSFCPNNAVDDVKKICIFISEKEGGKGVVREFYDLWRRKL